MSTFGNRLAAAAGDKWGILAAAFGAGVTWAIGLPVGGIAIVGGGMYAAAVAAGLFRGSTSGSTTPTVPELRPGTTQDGLVRTLAGYRTDLRKIAAESDLPSALAPSAAAAADAADNAHQIAVRVALAVDELDEALGRAVGLAQQTRGSGAAGVQESLTRMSGRRQRLLGDLDAGVGGVAEIYANLLDLSTSANLAGFETRAGTAVSDVNDSLDALRHAFAELEARTVT